MLSTLRMPVLQRVLDVRQFPPPRAYFRCSSETHLCWRCLEQQKTVFEQLEQLGINVPHEERFYPLLKPPRCSWVVKSTKEQWVWLCTNRTLVIFSTFVNAVNVTNARAAASFGRHTISTATCVLSMLKWNTPMLEMFRTTKKLCLNNWSSLELMYRMKNVSTHIVERLTMKVILTRAICPTLARNWFGSRAMCLALFLFDLTSPTLNNRNVL